MTDAAHRPDQVPLTSAAAPAPAPSARRPRWRLRALVALTAGVLGLYGFAQLDRSAAERLGPVVAAVHDQFSLTPPALPPDSAAARRFKAAVRALPATPGVVVPEPGFLGVFGRVEDYTVNAHEPAFDDAALARLADQYGDRITGLMIQNTSVTDAGLRALVRFPHLRHLVISQSLVRPRADVTPIPSQITDAGMAPLGELKNLALLTLNDLPITDAGLLAVHDLTQLSTVYLHGTKVEGRSLTGARWLPRLTVLYADQTPFGSAGLAALQGASSLQLLGLNRVPLTDAELPLLQALSPRLNRLELAGCGLLDTEVASLQRPGLTISRD